MIRFLLGLRPDLNLATRWWHRLFVVVFWLSAVITTALAVALGHRDPQLRVENIQTIADLQTFTREHPELPNSVPAFLALGEIGVRRAPGEVEHFTLSLGEIYCSARLAAHPDAVAAFLRANEPTAADMDSKGAAAWLEAQDKEKHEGNCLVRESALPGGSDSVIAYLFTTAARALSLGRALLVGLIAGAGWCVVTLNVYFRGIIYVVCGGRNRSDA